jgi:uncharacterized protein YciI
MFVVLLRFSVNQDKAGQLVESHKEWLQRGFDEGVFLLAGLLQPKLGGAILAHNASLSELQKRVSEDPFVKEQVVSPEILEFTPSRAQEKVRFLLEGENK